MPPEIQNTTPEALAALSNLSAKENPASPPDKPGQQPFKSPFTESKGRHYGRLIAVVTTVILIVGGATYYFLNNRKGNILIQTGNISGLTVTINDRAVKGETDKNGLLIKEYPGQYRVKITRTDFAPFTQDILLQKKQTVTIRPAFLLIPKASKADTTTTVDYVRPSLDQKALFYLGDNRQRIYRMEIANRVPVPLTDKPLSGVSDIHWSGAPDVAMINTINGTYLQEIPKYDFIHQDLVKIGGPEIVSPIWDPSNPDRVACVYAPPTGEYSLVFTDKQISKVDRKADLIGMKNPKLVWSPDSNYILVIDRSNDYSHNNVWIYNAIDGSFNQLSHDGNALDASFAPDSRHVLYETYAPVTGSPFTSALSIINTDGTGLTNLKTRGKVVQAAWKDNDSFFLPDLQKNTLILSNLSGQTKDLSFAFDNPQAVRGLFYFAEAQVLIFYTGQAIYSISLGV